MRRYVGTSAGGVVVSFNKDATKARAALLDRDGWEYKSHVVPAPDLAAALAALRIPEDEAERIANETLGQLDAQT
jgi:hypothetical protein